MRKILRLAAAAAVVVGTPLFGQTETNTALTGVEGLPWGATRAQVEAKFGRPDSVHVRGDSVNLIFSGQSVAGKSAMMTDVLIAPGKGMESVAYLVQQSPGDCVGTFEQVVAAITASHPGLRPGRRDVMAGGPPVTDVAGECRTYQERQDYPVIVTQSLRDPVGPGSVFLFSSGTYRRGAVLVIQFQREERRQRR